ncbi:hypothetical protein Pla8534_54380 [Lignipirellula cremea]|uniref:Flagellar basal body rod modification protein n=2 Tax=Lignipirellula cremea TaxID=2528010 RepID=A0A518E0H0_9BACT|nr:hypothetical protein Pla8534_54380 [Lignipirellula cremea]
MPACLRSSLAWQMVLSALLLACCLSPGMAAESDGMLAISIDDIDDSRCRQYLSGQAQPADNLMVRRALGLQPQAPVWKFGGGPFVTETDFQYLIVFKRAVPVGSIVCEIELDPASPQVQLSTYSPEATGEPDPAVPGQWQSLNLRQTLPPGFTTRALLVTDRRHRRQSALAGLLLLRPRFHSITHEAIGIAEKAPFGSHPNALPQGRTWTNTAPDPRPGAAKQVQRGPVSDVLPSWYLLFWDQPQTLAAVSLTCNANRYRLLSYRGDPQANPGLAPPSDWRPIEFTVVSRYSVGSEQSSQLLVFPTLQTQAIKLEMLDCDGPVAQIQRFDALVNLGDDPVPPADSGAPSPFSIPYEQPFDGELAMVITDAQGRPVRNLVAQQKRTAGPTEEAWDLKDESGRMVPPGEYHWKAITSPPLGVNYEMTVYPSAPQHFPGQTPWLTGKSEANGWLADHATHVAGTALGDHVYFGAPGVEGGVCLIECDLNGRKQWGRHSFASFTGLKRLAADDRAVFIYERDNLCRLDPESHEIQQIAGLKSVTRQGAVTGMAAASGEVYLSFHGAIPAFENATTASRVDLENCLPRYPERIPDPLGSRRVQPNPREEFLRLLRLKGTPPGQDQPPKDAREGHFPIDLETAGGDPLHQYLVVAFNAPTPVGSLMFPCPEAVRLELSVLKPSAPYPPRPQQDGDWISFDAQPQAGWVCLPAPPQTMTRAIRIQAFPVGEDAPSRDPLDAILDNTAKAKEPSIDGLLDRPKTASLLSDPGAGAKSKWFARIEGLKLLRRRFTSQIAPPRIRVNSGEVNAQGEWDAQRTAAVSSESPGVYLMEWDEPQQLAGLAIKEIDGEETLVEVWEGPASEPIALEGDEHWRQVAVYTQSRRDSYEPAFTRNHWARYLDGYVDFEEIIATRAVRLRVVKQWADQGNRNSASQRVDRGGRELDPRRCRIFGVAAMKYLGDEPAMETLTHQRIEVRDALTGELRRELPGSVDHSLQVNPQGELFGVSQQRIVRVDRQTGETTPVLPAVDGASLLAERFTIGPDGDFYVFVLPEKTIHVYHPSGERVRVIGHAGGQQPGPWDPQKFLKVETLFVDQADHLWVVESQYVPRRIVQYRTDGSLVKEFYGNTPYGGGGVLDRHDKSRLFFQHVQLEIDWQTGESRIKNLLATYMPPDYVPQQFQGRTYLTSAPLSYRYYQPCGVVYLLNEAEGTAQPAAAFGDARDYPPLKDARILAKLAPGKVLSDYEFVWTDQNGDGKPEPAEVTFTPLPSGARVQLGRFNADLTCCGGDYAWQVSEVLDNGVPVFTRQQLPAHALYELHGGKLLALHRPASLHRPGDEPRGAMETQVHAADGAALWNYPTTHTGVSGLYLPPWKPGYVTNEFGVIGHETADQGDLGEFFVTHANNGQWKIWTSDGLLAGAILRHKFSPGNRTTDAFPTAERGMSLDGLSAGQEHFHGYFTKTDQDGKFYLVLGHNYISLAEVTGLDQFRRLSGVVQVSADNVRQMQDWQEEQARREVKSLALTLQCLPFDGKELPDTAEVEEVTFGVAYDEQNLYLRWEVRNLGPFANDADDIRRMFKSGACVDFQLSVNPQAAPGRRQPVRGDQRLLIGMVQGKPRVVLYDAVQAGGPTAQAWETSTPAGGVTAFDRVVELTSVRVKHEPHESGQGYTVTATVPLRELGLKIVDGMRLKMDWGVIASNDGQTVNRRLYWANRLANGVTDEAVEARLEPHLWGTAYFASQSQAEQRLNAVLPDIDNKQRSTTDLDALLDDIKP